MEDYVVIRTSEGTFVEYITGQGLAQFTPLITQALQVFRSAGERHSEELSKMYGAVFTVQAAP